MADYGMIPPTGAKGTSWPLHNVLPQGLEGSLSMGGWTSDNEGFVQQTFLGASIRSFNVNAGFGDTSTTMGIELVNDEYNVSDKLGLGEGDDPYHNGIHDNFGPPVVGAPVFFKFGKNHATVEQAFRKTIDDIYNVNTLGGRAGRFPEKKTPLPFVEQPEYHYLVSETDTQQTWVDKSALYDPDKADTVWRGSGHFAFGGILQSYTENRSTQGNPLYSVKLVDPREILTNTELLLNNYQGTTFNNKNLFNIYGFLEHDLSHRLESELYSKDTTVPNSSYHRLFKTATLDGSIKFLGEDLFAFGTPKTYADKLDELGSLIGFIEPVETVITSDGHTEDVKLSGAFPMTGQGFSRRSDVGIPWYRVEAAMKCLFGYNQDLPKEYKDAGFGGVIDFRGYNYVVDWGGIPTDEIPNTYYLNFDKMSMMDLAQELCDVLSRDLYVSLLPIIDHPSMAHLYKRNQETLAAARDAGSEEMRRLILGHNLICGVIRIDTIDRKTQPKYGTVKKYLDELEAAVDADGNPKTSIHVQNRDVGFEVSNVTTDKFIAGAQEVEMYYFNNLRDRDNYLVRLSEHGERTGVEAKARLEQLNHDKWTLHTNLNQQILPFYGFLGDRAVTIPRGFGSWQQILLDARGLDAMGVGAYYVATEMELRAASVSFESWSNFLLNYNETYMEEISENKGFMGAFDNNVTKDIDGLTDQLDGAEIDNPDHDPDDPDSPEKIPAPQGYLKSQLEHLKNRDFAVTVPRCVWNSDKSPKREQVDNPDYDPVEPSEGDDDYDDASDNPNTLWLFVGGQFEGEMGKNGYPASPCSPPYGYPLYYQRANAIGIPHAGVARIGKAIINLRSNIKDLKDQRIQKKKNFRMKNASAARASIKQLQGAISVLRKERDEKKRLEGALDDAYIKKVSDDVIVFEKQIDDIKANLKADKDNLDKLDKDTKAQIVLMETSLSDTTKLQVNVSRAARQNLENAKKIHKFLKKIADDNLGKKFLIKIPKMCNANYSDTITHFGTSKGELEEQDEDKGVQKEDYYAPVNNAWDVVKGPFGFEPQPINGDPGYKDSPEWKRELVAIAEIAEKAERSNLLAFQDFERGFYDSTWPMKSNVHWHYLDSLAWSNANIGSFGGLTETGTSVEEPYPNGYGYGALKCNFNPMSEKWEYNYLPEPQGGFFNYALYDQSLGWHELEWVKNPKYVSAEDTPNEDEFLSINPIKLPLITRSILAPKLMDKIGKNGRIKCYVRFDHSQDYDFSKLDSKVVEQQSIGEEKLEEGVGNAIIPDVIESLPNQNPDTHLPLDEIGERVKENELLGRQAQSVAFVTAEIDPQFYMAPGVVMSPTENDPDEKGAKVWAQDYSIQLAETPYDIFWIEDTRETIPDPEDPDGPEIDNPNKGCQVPTPVVQRINPLFGVPKGGGILKKTDPEKPVELEPGEPEYEEVDDIQYVLWDDFDREWSNTYKGWIIKTKEKDLDPENVYALITLPGKIIPTISKRFVDGELKTVEADRIGHAMMEDVVKIDEFWSPAPIDNAETGVDCSQEGINWSFKDLVAAEQAQKAIVDLINKSSHHINRSAPSPVYPDMVALPLLSMERCYGPWLSSALDGVGVLNKDIKYSDIGGKIEFIKDEKLAPWNYAGYQLMNDAGKLQTQFSNSLLLLSERGAFTYSEAPTGVALAKGLQDGGPLVTSISVDISAKSISTSVKLDLYTSQFGKLNKQKEIAIAQISRERQKIIDQNNLLERRGMAKRQMAESPFAYNHLLENGGQGLLDRARQSEEFIKEANKPTIFTVSATNQTTTYDGTDPSHANSPPPSMEVTTEGTQGAIQTHEQLVETDSLYYDGQQIANANNRTAGESVDTLFKGYSHAPDDPYFASVRMSDAIRSVRDTRNMG